MNARKLLLAEDDTDDQKLFCDFLQHRSDIVLLPAAENGEVLIDSLGKIRCDDHLPDLIVLDQNMPKRTGLQTLESLKENTRFSHIPVMIYSTYADEHLVRTASEKGATLVVPKPLSEEGYNEMIDQFLKIVSGVSEDEK